MKFFIIKSLIEGHFSAKFIKIKSDRGLCLINFVKKNTIKGSFNQISNQKTQAFLKL